MYKIDRPHFLDTSALVKLIIPERGSKCVCDLWDRGGELLHTSQLAVGETIGVLKLRLKREEYRRAIFEFFFTRLRECRGWDHSLLKDRGAFWNANHELLAEGRKLDVVDLVHVYHLLVDFNEPPVLVSADKDLNRYVERAEDCRKKGISVLNPEKMEA